MPELRKELGKIDNVRLGVGGYDDAMIGLSLTFSMGGSGVGTFIPAVWSSKEVNPGDAKLFVDRLRDLLVKAKVNDVYKLKGVPVEVTLNGNTFDSFRILEEVL